MSPRRIAILTEGDAEYAALPSIVQQLNALTTDIVLRPLKVNCQPDAAPGVVARQCKPAIKVATARRADLVVLVLDREQRQDCPGLLAEELMRVCPTVCGAQPVVVVYKNRTFENWLVADMDALAAQPARFAVTPASRRRVEPNRSDSINGYQLLQQLTGNEYDKVKDGVRICAHMDVLRAARHSRSLRHLLHVLGCITSREVCRSGNLP